MMTTRTLLPVLIPGLAVLLAAADSPKERASGKTEITSSGADWPQWRGPDRNDISHETGLLKTWPKTGPKLLWTYEETGIGYSGPSVVGDHLYVMGADEKNEFVQAINVKSGKKVWSSIVGEFYQNKYGSGPRSTPAVDGGHLYVLGANGDLSCLDRSTGAKKWSVNLTDKKGTAGGRPVWGYSESPLVDGDRVVCSPGGSKGTLAAFDKETGKLLWQSKEVTDQEGYSSVVVAQLGGVRQYVQQTMNGVAGIAPADGKRLWYYPEPGYKVAVIPTVLVHNGLVYAVAGYGAGASLLQLENADGKFNARNLYSEEARGLMDNKHGGVLAVGDLVFGWSDASRGKWVCQDFKTGKEVWKSTAQGRGSVTCADGNLYCYSEKDGTCVLVPAVASGWKEQGRFTIPRHTKDREFNNNIWTHPVVANGKLYLRDQELLFCYDVKNAAP
jgi:outer membrane protein assembly factor BamB